MAPWTDEDFISGVDVSSAQDGGIIKVVKKEGDATAGRPCAGDSVFVHYVGTLLDGSKFDSSRDRDSLFDFKLGEGMVIKGWDEGVASMNKGEVALLKCHAKYAYGENGSPPKIPPNAELVFEVELFYWKGADLTDKSDGGIMKSIRVKGTGYKKPQDGDTVTVEVEGKCDGTVFDTRTITFVVGEGEDHDLFDGFETALRNMNVNEKAEVTFKPQYGFGDKGCSKLGVPAGAHLVYSIHLKEMDRGKETWEMDAAEKVATSEACKIKGSQYFKEGKLQMAVRQYRRVTDYLDDFTDFEDEVKTKANELLLATHLNLAMCHLKEGNSYDCIQATNAAIAIDPDSVKGHFRRGEALILQKDWTAAKADFDTVLKSEPENKAAKNKSAICLSKLKTEKEKEKRAYQHIFKTMWLEQEEKDKKEKKEEKVEAPSDDPAADDVLGQEEAADIPVLSQS